ncbi:hypothetical protein [Anabaena sp. 90]|nr:hypothetical protein [Anabaena sp. 90]
MVISITYSFSLSKTFLGDFHQFLLEDLEIYGSFLVMEAKNSK